MFWVFFHKVLVFGVLEARHLLTRLPGFSYMLSAVGGTARLPKKPHKPTGFRCGDSESFRKRQFRNVPGTALGSF